MRKGAEYRRCGSCGRTVRDSKAKDCPNCGGTRITWAFKVASIVPQADPEPAIAARL